MVGRDEVQIRLVCSNLEAATGNGGGEEREEEGQEAAWAHGLPRYRRSGHSFGSVYLFYMSRIVALGSRRGTRGVISGVCRAPYDGYQGCGWKFEVIAIRPADARQTASEPIAALGLPS